MCINGIIWHHGMHVQCLMSILFAIFVSDYCSRVIRTIVVPDTRAVSYLINKTIPSPELVHCGKRLTCAQQIGHPGWLISSLMDCI